MALLLTSPVIEPNGNFPPDYTCNGRNVNPPLRISGVPDGAATLVLIFDDPDAAKEPAGSGKTFDHWIIYNIPAVDQNIAEASIPTGGQFGKNSLSKGEYIGPCPPTFRHEYHFHLLALDSSLELTNLPTKSMVEQAIGGHVIEKAELIAYYQQPVGK
jgi:Raf kinase inhibitor-like YbhB/YbcL family protein